MLEIVIYPSIENFEYLSNEGMKFLIIENNSERARKFEELGIDTIFVDLEILGKQERQRNIDSVKSKHRISDIKEIKLAVKKAEILVRIDPVNSETKSQIDEVIKAGADVIMLPFFKTYAEVEFFFKCIDGRIRTKLLFEHIDSLVLIELIHKNFGVNEVYFGLNDLSLSLGYNFMFRVLTDNVLDAAVKYCKKNNISFGIGGIGKYHEAEIPGKIILQEYIRLGATSTIVSRGLANLYDRDKNLFIENINLIRSTSKRLDGKRDKLILEKNFYLLKRAVEELEFSNKREC